MKKIIKINGKGNIQKSLTQCINYMMILSNKLIRTISNIFRKINNKLNIYTEIKREYKFQNIMEEKLTYMISVNDGYYKSNINILIISKNNDNQQNYFNC